jgi:hypothetical protein
MRIIEILKCSDCPYFKVRWAGDIIGAYAKECDRYRQRIAIIDHKSPYSIPQKYIQMPFPEFCLLPKGVSDVKKRINRNIKR